MSDMLIGYLVVINLMELMMMWVDKCMARNGKTRIPERVLLFFAIIGGSIGGILGMILCRHKIRKPLFLFGFPAALAFHIYLYIHFLLPRMANGG